MHLLQHSSWETFRPYGNASLVSKFPKIGRCYVRKKLYEHVSNKSAESK